MIEDIALKKYGQLNDGSFVPHKGVVIRHTDGSSLTVTNAFIEKYRGNDKNYIFVYTKNHGVLAYPADSLELIYEFHVAVPTTLFCVQPKKSWLAKWFG